MLPPVPGERCTAVKHMECGTGEHCRESCHAAGCFFVSAYASVSGNRVSIAEHAVLQAANDAICRGGVPRSVELQVLFPVWAEEAHVRALVGAAQSICDRLDVELAAFQAQVVPAVGQILVSVTARAHAARLLRMQDARAGQEIVACGFAGLEGSLRIAGERKAELEGRFAPAFLRQMEGLKVHLGQAGALQVAREWHEGEIGQAGAPSPVARQVTPVVPRVFAMQQAASGGIFAALWELCEAAGTGLEVDLKKIPIRQETIEVCECYQLNPYQMTSAGCVLLVTDDAEGVLDELAETGAGGARIGRITADKARIVLNGGEKRFLERPAPDELARFQERGPACGRGGAKLVLTPTS